MDTQWLQVNTKLLLESTYSGKQSQIAKLKARFVVDISGHHRVIYFHYIIEGPQHVFAYSSIIKEIISGHQVPQVSQEV